MSNFNTSQMLPVGTVLKDTYRIEGFLSSGGFGNTYVATNFTFNEKVAVKEFFLRGVNLRDGESTVSVSNPDNRVLFDEQLEKFRKEAQRIRKLRSPHVVRVHDLFDANGTAYYVMDYIDGESLAARLRRTQQPLSESEAMGYFSQVLDALEAIHAAGLCHMDLKPDNVMVDKEDNAVLIDFGASKRIASDQLTSTVTGVSYTNGYAPPEQLESDTDNFGPWTDLYALGATLYKLLTNRKPPMPSSIYSDPTPDKSKSLPFPGGVSEQTRQLVRRLMTVVWHERPQSVTDVRRMMGQVEQTEQRTTEYQPQETIFIGDLDLPDDGEVPTLVRNKPQADNNTDYYHYEEQVSSSSRKWLYTLIGILAIAVFLVGFLLLKNADNTNVSNGGDENNEEQTITVPKLKDGDYYYEGYWKTTAKDSSQCLLQFKKQGDTLSNCSFTNVAYAKTIPLTGEINENKLHFSGNLGGEDVIVDVENNTADGSFIKGSGQDNQSGLQSIDLYLTRVDLKRATHIINVAQSASMPSFSDLSKLADNLGLWDNSPQTDKNTNLKSIAHGSVKSEGDGYEIGGYNIYGKNVTVKKDSPISGSNSFHFQSTSDHACYVLYILMGVDGYVEVAFNNKSDADTFANQRSKRKTKRDLGGYRAFEGMSNKNGWWVFSWGNWEGRDSPQQVRQTRKPSAPQAPAAKDAGAKAAEKEAFDKAVEGAKKALGL